MASANWFNTNAAKAEKETFLFESAEAGFASGSTYHLKVAATEKRLPQEAASFFLSFDPRLSKY